MSQAARCSSSWTISGAAAAVAVLALAGCGKPWQAKFEGPFGKGSDQYWVVRAHGRPKAVVALLHGLAPSSGEQLEPWQVAPGRPGLRRDLPALRAAAARTRRARPRGDAASGPNREARQSRRTARPARPLARRPPRGRGGGVPEAAARARVLSRHDQHRRWSRRRTSARSRATTNIYLFVGDRDTGVGNDGAVELDRPPARVRLPGRPDPRRGDPFERRISPQTICRSTTSARRPGSGDLGPGPTA